jgi:hypothetical protein
MKPVVSTHFKQSGYYPKQTIKLALTCEETNYTFNGAQTCAKPQ